MTDNTDIRQLADLPIANVLFPDKAGPRMLPYNVPIAAGVEFELDLMQAQLTAKENRIQSMEIDNTRGGADVIVQMGFQRIQIAVGEIQLIPLFVSGSPLVFRCDVANVVPVKFFNVPLPAYTRQVKGTRVFQGSFSAASTVALAAVSGRSYIITQASAYLSGNASIAVAGLNLIQIVSSTGGIVAASSRPFLPAASPASPLFGEELFDRNIYVKLPEGAGVNVNLASALATGSLEVNINYTLV